jgi:hypothetical protein
MDIGTDSNTDSGTDRDADGNTGGNTDGDTFTEWDRDTFTEWDRDLDWDSKRAETRTGTTTADEATLSVVFQDITMKLLFSFQILYLSDQTTLSLQNVMLKSDHQITSFLKSQISDHATMSDDRIMIGRSFCWYFAHHCLE